MQRQWLIGFFTILAAPSAFAEWSGNAALVSDYLFNGITQTDKEPALQLGVDWTSDSGVYAGLWGANVDYSNGSDTEIDAWAGYSFSVSKSIEMDIGVAFYSYHGSDISDEGNYPEVYVKTSYKDWHFNVWYSNDYFGTEAGHVIAMVNYVYPVSEDKSLTFGIDRSTSLDDERFAWGINDDDYIHWQVVFDWQLERYAVSLGLHDTDLKDDDSSMFVVGVSTAF
ncbi:MAG: TorF family putative porin [Aestuariibacter sp.]